MSKEKCPMCGGGNFNHVDLLSEDSHCYKTNHEWGLRSISSVGGDISSWNLKGWKSADNSFKMDKWGPEQLGLNGSEVPKTGFVVTIMSDACNDCGFIFFKLPIKEMRHRLDSRQAQKTKKAAAAKKAASAKKARQESAKKAKKEREIAKKEQELAELRKERGDLG